MDIRYKEVETLPEFIDAIRLRVDVFIKEQGFQHGWEPDEEDKISRHFIASADGLVIGEARVRETEKGSFKIERMVTKKEYRGQGIGSGLVKYVINEMIQFKPRRIWLRSQLQSQRFYEKAGFKAVSEPFDMWGVKHIDMDYTSLK